MQSLHTSNLSVHQIANPAPPLTFLFLEIFLVGVMSLEVQHRWTTSWPVPTIVTLPPNAAASSTVQGEKYVISIQNANQLLQSIRILTSV